MEYYGKDRKAVHFCLGGKERNAVQNIWTDDHVCKKTLFFGYLRPPSDLQKNRNVIKKLAM